MEVIEELRNKAVAFVAYISDDKVQRTMGTVKYLLDYDIPVRGLVGPASDFVATYLNSARNMLPEQQEYALLRLLRRSPFKQGGLEPSDILPRILLRHPDASQMFSGNVHAPPRAIFAMGGGWRTSLTELETRMAAVADNHVYVSEDSLYMVSRRIDPYLHQLAVNIAMPRGSIGTIFKGTIDIVSTLDEHPVALSPVAIVANAPDGKFAGSSLAYKLVLSSGEELTEFVAGSLREVTIRLGSNMKVTIDGAQPADVRGFIIRLRGKFYLTSHGYANLQSGVYRMYPTVDSWNHGYDGLHLSMLSLREHSDTGVMDTLNEIFEKHYSTRLRRSRS